MLPFPPTSGQELHPLLESLAERIRDRRSELPDLRPLSVAPQLEFIRGMLEGEDLFIRNEIHRCRGLRKLHLEIASLGSGLQILHCVFFPEPRFDLPIFGSDVVAGPAGISAAIVDLSPVGPELPATVLRELQTLHMPPFLHLRELPAWGSIFSPYVYFIRPADNQEEGCFLDLVDAYLRILKAALLSTNADALDSASTIQRHHFQHYYCLQQKRNDKTRSVLAKAFNPQWADRYIEELLFDFPPLG